MKKLGKALLGWDKYGLHAQAKYLLKALIFGKEHINKFQNEISAL